MFSKGVDMQSKREGKITQIIKKGVKKKHKKTQTDKKKHKKNKNQ